MRYLLIIMLLLCPAAQLNAAQLLTGKDILNIPYKKADHRIFYGSADKKQYGDLRLPKGQGPFPVLIVIHGGCWSWKFANLDFMSPFAEAFTNEGIATWNIEFNGADSKDGGWPNTFKDIGSAIDYVRILAPRFNLDLSKVVVVGHSSGGHLALWSGARKSLKPDNEAFITTPLDLKAVVNIAGPADLKHFMENLQEKACGEKIINKLLGDDDAKVAQNVNKASPYELLPFGVKQVIIYGDLDETLKSPNARSSYISYVDKAISLDERLDILELRGVGHFEPIDPRSEDFQAVKQFTLELFNN